MHELSLLESVREILEAEAISQNFSKVTQITLEIGKLSCVEPEALRFGFDVVMKDSLAENAKLVIIEQKGLGFCQNCGTEAQMDSLHEPCHGCGSFGLTVTKGNEMKIQDLMVI